MLEDTNFYYFVMEYIDGCDLRKFIQRLIQENKKLNKNQILDIYA